MGIIKDRFKEKADVVAAEIKDLLKEHGNKVIGEVQLAQIYQGMRGMTGLVTETSLLDAQDGIRFRGYSIPELQQKLPKAEFAGTSTIVFAVINAAKILPYQNLRPYSMDTLHSAAVLIPFALVGAVGGAWLTRRIADVWFYRIVQAGLFLVSLKLMGDALR